MSCPSTGSDRRVTVAHAHTGRQAYVFFRARGSEIFGNVQFPAADLNQILNLDLPLTREEGSAALPSHLGSIERYIDAHFSMNVDGADVEYRIGESRFIEPDAGAYVVTKYRVDHELSRPARVGVSFDGLIEAVSDRTALLIVLNGHGYGRFTTETESRYELSSDVTHIEFDLEKPSVGQDLRGSTKKLRRAVSNRLGI